MIIGYARVSTEEQNLDAQVTALNEAGAERIFDEKISGSIRSRPALDRMLDQLRSGDVVLVSKYDRLARSLPDLLDIVAKIEEAGAGFRSLAEDIDTTTPAGRLIFHVFASRGRVRLSAKSPFKRFGADVEYSGVRFLTPSLSID